MAEFVCYDEPPFVRCVGTLGHVYDATTGSPQEASLLPPAAVTEMEQRFGATFGHLSEVQKLALTTVAVEGKVTHARLHEMTSAHTRAAFADILNYLFARATCSISLGFSWPRGVMIRE